MVGAQRVLRWTGTVKFGPRSLAALDSYVSDTVASAKLLGGSRQGGWVVSDFHRSVMRPAMHALTAPPSADGSYADSGDEATRGDTLVMSGGFRAETTWFNYTTLTYTSELCVEVRLREDVPEGLPHVRFTLMRHRCL